MRAENLRIARLALLVITIFCALAVDVFGVMPRAVEGARNGDYSTFYAAGRIDHAKLYDFAAITRAQEPIIGRVDSVRPYLNPPTYLFILKPLARLPVNVGLAVWAASTTLLFLAACLLVARPPVIALALVSPVIWSTAAGGQVALLVGACIIAGMALLEKRPILAGALFAAAALIKPPAVVLVPLALIACHQWRALSACLTAGAVVGLASVLVHGFDLWLQWFEALRKFSQFLQFSDVIEKGSSPATLARVTRMHGSVALVFQAACGVVGLAVVWRVFRRTKEPLQRLASLTTGCLLVTPYAMTQELTPMLPAAAFLLLSRGGHPLFWFASFLVLASLAAPIGVILMGIALLFAPWPEPPVPTAKLELN